MPKLSVIIPNWNGAELLKICLASLKKQTFKDFELIVVDNGSTDQSIELIRKDFKAAKIVTLDTNTGFAFAVNAGISHALSELIVLINNDTKLDPNCLKMLYQTACRKKDYAMFAAKMLNFYDVKKIDSAGSYITEVGHANGRGWQLKDSKEYASPEEVFLVCGGGALIRREVFDKIGLFDPNYFAYFEDVDLCLRAQLQGFKAWYVPSAIIYHVHKATSGRNQALTEYLQFRNMTITILKNFPLFFLKDHWLKIALVHLHTIWFLVIHGFAVSAFKAELYLIWHLPGILQQRKKIQDSKKINQKRFNQWIVPKPLHFWGKVF